MTSRPDRSPLRPPLTRARVLECALGLADAGGVGSLTIRSLAAELDVKPMSVYHHVPNKEAILDGIVDLVFAEMEIGADPGDPGDPGDTSDWRGQIERRARATRRVLGRHPWAIGLLESRETPGPATLHHHDETIGILRGAGFSVEMTAHALALLDSFGYGFAIQEAARLFERANGGPSVTPAVAEPLDPAAYPHLVEMAEQHVLLPGYDFGDEFDLGLDVILGALARSLDAGGSTLV